MKTTITLTPGVNFLLRNVPFLIAPSSIIFICLSYYDISARIWISIVTGVLSLPFIFVFSSTFARYGERIRASRRGAQLPPIVKEGWGIFGEVKVAQTILREHKTGHPGNFASSWPAKYGNTFLIRLPLSGLVFTTDPEIIKAVLATQFDSFEKGPASINSSYSVLGTGVFNSDGDMWKFHRALTRPFFTKARISDFDTFDRHGQHAIQVVRSGLKSAGYVDFQEIINRFTLDSASSFLFGLELDTLSSLDINSAPTKKADNISGCSADEFSRAFSEAQELIAIRSVKGPSWALSEISKDITEESMKVVDAFLGPIVQKALGTLKGVPAKKQSDFKAMTDVNEGDSLIDHLVRNTDDPVVIKDEILNILIAGKDTTASTLSFIVYLLATNTKVLSRLRKEILDVVGTNSRPTSEDFKEMKYLRAVINETLRLYPIVPFDGRTANKDAVIKSSNGEPFFVPKDTAVIYSVFQMHRRKDLWGPDALVFDPDRFIDQRLQKYLVKNPFIFLPFNAGPRICLGQQFAYNEMSFFLVRLLQTFSEISLVSPPHPRVPSMNNVGNDTPPERKDPDLKFHLTMFLDGGLWVNMKEAEQ